MLNRRLSILLMSLFILVGCKQYNIESTDPKPEAGYNTPRDKSNALNPKGNEGNEVVLVSGGNTEYVILVPDQPSGQETKAAEELAKWLAVMSDTQIPIIGESRFKKGQLVLSIGKTRLYQQAVGKSTQSLGEEGYAIHQNGESLFFVGGSRRGPINAVIAFLEEDLGCRWYTRDESSYRIPHREEVRLNPVLREEKPAFEVRELMFWDAFDEHWGLYNRMNATRSHKTSMREEWGGYTDYPRGWSEHTFRKLIPAEQFEAHPEYFSQRKGNGKSKRTQEQLCVTNTDGKRIAIERALRAFAKPKFELLSISQNDGRFNYCRCQSCQTSIEKYGVSGTYLNFVNDIAREIEKEYPGKMVSTLAYYHTFEPPTVRPRGNVLIELCTNDHWPRRYEPVRNNQDFVKVLNGWQALDARVHIWDYPAIYSHYLLPFPTIDVFTDNLRFYHESGVGGVLFQGTYQTNAKGAMQNALKSWVWSKLMWNPRLDAEALVEDFIRGYFGLLAGDITEIHNRTYEYVRQGAEKMSPNNPPLPATIYQEFGEVFARMYAKSGNNPELDEKIERFELPYLYFRLRQGSLEASDLDRYEEDLGRFERLCRKHEITVLNERNPGTSLQDFLLNCRLKVNKVEAYEEYSSDAVIIDESNLRLSRSRKLDVPPVSISPHPQGRNGYCIQINALDKRRSVLLSRINKNILNEGDQYRIQLKYAYKSGARFQTRKSGEQYPSLRLKLKGIRKGPNSFSFNLFCEPKRKRELFETIELGDFTFKGTGDLYLEVLDPELLNQLWIDQIVFSRI